VREWPFFLAWHLGRDHRIGLGGGQAAVFRDARASCRDRCVHEDDAVHRVLELRLEQEGDVEDDDPCARGFGGGERVLAAGGNFRMHNRIERSALAGVVEDNAAERGAVEGSVGGEHSFPPALGDTGECRGTLLDRLAREAVGVNDERPVGREVCGDSRLSGGDVAREADDEHRVIVPRRRRFRTVKTPRAHHRTEPTPRASLRRAFTLIEILMVMALIGIVAGWAVSRVSLSSYRLDAAVRMLQNLVIGAQQTAITRNVEVTLRFDRNNHRVETRFVVDGTEIVTARVLPEGARFLIPTVGIDGAASDFVGGAGADGSPGVTFSRDVRIAPNGTMTGDVVVYVGTAAARPNDQRAVAITGATTRTAVWSYGSGAWRRRDY
jgi:prepilin-type N-terminal cleavage/methylation domain-containing protein